MAEVLGEDLVAELLDALDHDAFAVFRPADDLLLLWGGQNGVEFADERG